MFVKVGVIIVSYNSAQAVRITLASLRQAKNITPCELVLIDNSSAYMELE